MALINDLVNILNSEEEPLPKRLKIADHVFNSGDIYLQSKETYLLNWLTDITNNNAEELLSQWLSSTHFKTLNKIDVSHKCIKKIYEVIWERLNCNSSNKTVAILSALALIDNSIFHEYFKLNLKSYFHFLSKLIESIDDKHTLLNIIKNENTFNKIYHTSEKFYKYFLDLLLPALAQVDLKFKDGDVFQNFCFLIQKYVIRKNFKQCEDSLRHFYDDEHNAKQSILKFFLKSFLSVYDDSIEISTNVLRIYFTSICNEFSSNPLFVYKFSVILLQVIGFDVSEKFNLYVSAKFQRLKSFDKSLTAALVIFKLLTNFKIELDLKIGEISFSEFIKIVVFLLMNTGTPNKLAIEIIYCCLNIDPLVIDSVISEVLEYLLFSRNDCKTEYIQLLKTIFKIFVKLHRVQNFISKMFAVLKRLADEETTTAERKVSFNADIESMFPQEVISCFSDCVTLIASWQVMNLFKTFLHHLKMTVDDDLQNIMDDERKLVYVEATGIFLCEFLSSVRIAEHMVPDLVVNKFVKTMDELKITLGKFGNVLITMEHNHVLMRTFLNICYTWGELYMILSYYSTNVDISLTKIRKSDHSLSNISYIHPYLTAAQWSLISERVNNFGKTTCKQMMQNLYIQHIKAVLLFENTLNEEMIITLINNVMLSLDDLWYYIAEDTFILNNIVSKMQTTQILALTNLVMNNIHDPENVKKMLPGIINSEVMLKYLVYTVLEKINKSVKVKKTSELCPLSTIVFDEFQKALCLESSDCILLNTLLELFNEEQIGPISNSVIKVNHEKLVGYLKVLTVIPVMYISNELKTCTALYLLAVLNDLRNIDKDNSQCREYLEMLLAGILQTTPKRFVYLLTPKALVHLLVNNTRNYKKIFTCVMDILYNEDNFIEQIQKISNYLIENIANDVKYVHCLIILLFSMLKQKKAKISSENKNNITQVILHISEELTLLLASEKIQSLTLYALILKTMLSSNKDVSQLLSRLQYYRKIALCDNENADHEGIMLLLQTIMYHKSKFEIVNDDFILQIWNKYKSAKVPAELTEEKGKLIALIAEHISNEQFANIVKDLLESTKSSRCSKNNSDFENYMNIWSNILSSKFNPVKNRTWIQTLQGLLQELLLLLSADDNIDIQKRIVLFETYLVQTVHVQLNISMLDTMLLTVSKCVSSGLLEIESIKLLDVLLRYRKSIVADILPSFLQQYRILLVNLCEKSISNTNNLNVTELEKYAH
ncbi:hypothetical protein AMK59_8762, partial [Oryctes borbonicus]